MLNLRATASTLKKAFIQVLNSKGRTKDTIPVLFNPGDYSIDKSNEFANINIPGLESPLLQFSRGGLESLTLDLFFDTWDASLPGFKKDVRDYTKKVVNLLKIDSSMHAPPIVRFVWGSLSFTSVIQKVTQKFTMFSTDGTPVRATLGVTFNLYSSESAQKGVHLESWDRTKHYVTTQGDTLWQIAWEEFGDASMWRLIAKHNHIEDPRSLNPGTDLSIPAVE